MFLLDIKQLRIEEKRVKIQLVVLYSRSGGWFMTIQSLCLPIGAINEFKNEKREEHVR